MRYSGLGEFLWSLSTQVKDQRLIAITFLVPHILPAVPQALYCSTEITVWFQYSKPLTQSQIPFVGKPLCEAVSLCPHGWGIRLCCQISVGSHLILGLDPSIIPVLMHKPHKEACLAQHSISGQTSHGTCWPQLDPSYRAGVNPVCWLHLVDVSKGLVTFSLRARYPLFTCDIFPCPSVLLSVVGVEFIPLNFWYLLLS